ncbi:AMP-binding protein [Novosphingobium colocasiae]|nr:AMP-binding protein [Novosphingobium colocasiae]
MARRLHTFGYELEQMTVPFVVADKAERNGDKHFLEYLADGRRFTYREVHLITNRIANAMRHRGLGSGDHVAVMMDNCPEQFFTYIALAKIGAVSVPLNSAAKGVLLTYLLAHSDTVMVVLESNYLGRLTEIADTVPAIRGIFVLPDGTDRADTSGNSWVIEPYDALLTGSEAGPETAPAVGDLAMLAYTSGTTGPSKGNSLAQGTVISYGCTTAESNGYRDDDTVYVCLPLNHANALLCSVFGAWMANAAVALSRRFSVSGYWGEVKRSGATVTNVLGSMMNFLWSSPASPEDRENPLRVCNVVPMPAFARDYEQRFGLRLISGYGLTDYCLATVYSTLAPTSKLGSSGTPRSGVEVRIVNEADAEIPTGEVGEIVLRSNNPWGTSQGYYKNAEATLAANRNGWWHTGDRGYLDADGYLWFADRKKDAIRRRGENISSFEVETVLLRHPAIADVAAYPLKAEHAEDEVAVSVVLVEGQQLSEAELIAFASANMAYYMVPRFVRFMADMPRTQNQKVEKYRLRQEAEADTSLMWDREAAGIEVKR